jgi:PAP2 superfamily
VHIGWPATVDQRLFDAVPTVWLQHRLYSPGTVHSYEIAASLVYFSFFLAVPLTMAVLWLRDRTQWRQLTARVVVVSLAALVTYVIFPEAPPWYAARHGVIGPVARISGLGWSALGLRSAGELIEHGQALANNVAAMPSLHMAYTVLITLFFLRRVRQRRAKPLLMAYTIGMALALVYTGEHYVIDIIAGIAYPALIDTAVSAATAARRIRTAAPSRGRRPELMSPKTADVVETPG